jgi:hypothetical protein
MYQTGPDMGFFFPFIPGRYLLVLGTNLKLSYQSCTHIRSKAHLCLASGKLKKPGTYLLVLVVYKRQFCTWNCLRSHTMLVLV